MSMVCTVDLGPIDRNVYNVGDLIDDDYISISTYILNGFDENWNQNEKSGLSEIVWGFRFNILVKIMISNLENGH